MGFNGRFVLNLIQFASRNGANFHELIKLTGRSESDLAGEDCILDSSDYNKVLERAADETKDDYFGLHAGESLNLAAAGLIAQITLTSRTVKEALDYCCEFAQLGCSSLPMNLVEQNGEYLLTMLPEKLWGKQSPLSVRHTVEGTLAFTIREYHSLTLNKHYPLRIELPFKAPKDDSEYNRLLGCPVYFNRDGIAIWFSKKQIEARVMTSDYQLLRILVEHAEEKLSRINENLGVSHRVRSTIIQLVSPQFPTLDQVASHMNMSVRTLQRRLSDEETTYKSILDALRHDFALSYLERQELSIYEISYLLSYNDPSSFIRSFKRNTGQTPREFRMEALN